MKLPLYLLLALSVGVTACSSNDDSDGNTAGTDSADGDGGVDGTDATDGDGGTTGTDGGTASSVGSYQFIFTNTSTTQPMTPPVVAIHTPQSAEGGIRLFEVGQPAIAEVIEIAENGDNAPLVAVATGQLGQTVSAAGVAFVDPANPGPILPGQSATLDLTTESEGQVMSLVSMVVCTNDGFSGIDSAALPDTTVTVNAPIYDAGSEVNVLELNYWVPPCGGEGLSLIHI